nr:hypothetical protein [Tanacetum cinerariifolium]
DDNVNGNDSHFFKSSVNSKTSIWEVARQVSVEVAQESEADIVKGFDLNQEVCSEEVDNPFEGILGLKESISTSALKPIIEGTHNNSKQRLDCLDFDLNAADGREDKTLPSGDESSVVLFNHNACVAAAVAAINSASHDDSDTVACLCVLQLIAMASSSLIVSILATGAKTSSKSMPCCGGVIGPHKSPYTKSKCEVDLAFAFFGNGALLCLPIKHTLKILLYVYWQSNTPPDSYSAASYFRGVTDWYQEPRYYCIQPLRRAIRRRITKSGWTTRNARGSIRICCSCVSGPTFTGLRAWPEELEQAPPSPVYIPYVTEPEYPEYILPDDKSDPDEDPEDDDDEDPEEDPTDYPADHDDEEEEEEPSGDDVDEDYKEQDEDDDDDEEEHPASADSIPPPPALCVTARISSRPQPPLLSFTKEDAERFFAMPIPQPSPLTPLSSPLPQIPSPSLPPSPSILLIPLPATSLPLQLLSSGRRADRLEVTLPPRKRMSIVHCPGYEAGESSVAAAARPMESHRADYGFYWVTKPAAVQEQNTQDIYGVIEDTHGRQMEIFQRVEALVDDSQYHYETSRMVDQEAIISRVAWAHSIGLSSAVHFELQGYMTHTWVQDQRIDAQDALITTLTTQLSSLQGHLVMALGEIQALQTREQTRTCAPEGASCST